MPVLLWNQVGQRFYETGVDRGVLYTPSGVAWNGLVSVDEQVSGGDAEAFYFDGVKYLDFIAAEDYQAQITAFSAPAEFGQFDGSKSIGNGLIVTGQPRTTFGMCYRTRVGNDISGTDLGYKLHLVYNIMASPSVQQNRTIGENVEPGVREWSLNAVPFTGTGSIANIKPTAHLIVDSTKYTTTTQKTKLTNLENLLYGTSSTTASLPIPSVVASTLA